MKFFETHFDDYIKSYDNLPLHNLNFDNLSNFNNFILHGPDGIGKYTQSLLLIKQHSFTNLKYEKKFELSYNKNIYYFKISDIHYEVDMSLLGCNAKLLWHEIYNQIVDIISSKNIKKGFILCKNFQEIDNEIPLLILNLLLLQKILVLYLIIYLTTVFTLIYLNLPEPHTTRFLKINYLLMILIILLILSLLKIIIPYYLKKI